MTFQLVLIKVCVQLQVQTVILSIGCLVPGTSAENITCNTTSTVSTPCSASVSRKRSAEMDGDDDDDNENDHERSENDAVCNTSPQVQMN